MPQARIKAAIIIPAYNEAAVIATIIKDIKKTFAMSHFNITIVVVDDGSTDATAAKATRAGAKVIKHLINTGSGSASATGLKFARKNGFKLAATMDGDGQHHPKDVLKGLSLLQATKADLLIGSRAMKLGEMSLLKTVGNKGLSLATRLLFSVSVSDSQSGLRIFSDRALAELRWKSSGYEFCSEMLWRAKQAGLAIGEFPIKTIYSEYSRAKGQTNWNGINIIKILLHQRVVEIFNE